VCVACQKFGSSVSRQRKKNAVRYANSLYIDGRSNLASHDCRNFIKGYDYAFRPDEIEIRLKIQQIFKTSQLLSGGRTEILSPT